MRGDKKYGQLSQRLALKRRGGIRGDFFVKISLIPPMMSNAPPTARSAMVSGFFPERK
jgi:hypothetical protein